VVATDSHLSHDNGSVPALRIRLDFVAPRLEQFNLPAHQALIFRKRVVVAVNVQYHCGSSRHVVFVGLIWVKQLLLLLLGKHCDVAGSTRVVIVVVAVVTATEAADMLTTHHGVVGRGDGGIAARG